MSTTNTATLFPPTAFLPRYPRPLPILDSQGSPAAVATTPAALEFALLEAWLASNHTLQLPLHEIESQQQTKGREGHDREAGLRGAPRKRADAARIADPQQLLVVEQGLRDRVLGVRSDDEVAVLGHVVGAQVDDQVVVHQDAPVVDEQVPQ